MCVNDQNYWILSKKYFFSIILKSEDSWCAKLQWADGIMLTLFVCFWVQSVLFHDLCRNGICSFLFLFSFFVFFFIGLKGMHTYICTCTHACKIVIPTNHKIKTIRKKERRKCLWQTQSFPFLFSCFLHTHKTYIYITYIVCTYTHTCKIVTKTIHEIRTIRKKRENTVYHKQRDRQKKTREIFAKPKNWLDCLVCHDICERKQNMFSFFVCSFLICCFNCFVHVFFVVASFVQGCQ